MPKKFNPLKQWLTGVGVIIGLVFLTTAAKAQSVSISASANPICNGTFVTFMATPSGTSEPVTYAWYLNGTLTNSTGNTYSNPYLANGNTIVCYMSTGGFNYASNTITMTVGSLGYYYLDADGDGFGAGSPIPACTPPGSSYVTNNQDCNDSNPNIKPTATEIRCNGIDENCNGMADDTGPEIELLGLGQVIPDGSTTVRIADDTDYGSVTVGTNANHTFQISNTGTQNLTITNISATNSTEFNANQSGYTFPFVIGASSSANFIVRFTPSSGGIRTTTLSIVSNDCDEATYDIKLQGSATFVTTTTVTSSLNPSLTGSNATLTARVAALNGNPVTSGTVTFTEGVAVLAANVALNSNGQAGFSTAGLSAGSHVITATYSGAADFNISSGMITQVVNNCPTLTASPGSAIITNSTCGAGCILGGGSIAAPSGTCPIGSTLQYQLNGGAWSNSLPAYAQTGPVQTIKTRCTCDIDPTVFSTESSVTTVPGTVPALNIPANGAATVACLSLATPPTPPVVNACNGSPITPSDVVTNSPNPLTCEGTRTYTYTYSCGSNTAVWSFVYTIEREPFTVPTNGAATVACLANATAPTLPTVLSHCGETLTPSAPVITDSPTSLTCEGTRTYAYTFTDCEGNTAIWSFVYTIEREPFTIATPNGAATVYNPALATPPTLPTVLSHCGETLTPAAPVITNAPNPLLCEGTRTYAYTYTDCEGNTATWSFVYTILDNIPPLITCPANLTVCESTMVTYMPPVGTDNCIGSVTVQIAGLPTGSVFPLGVTTNTFQVTATNSQTAVCSFTVTVNPLPTASISGTTVVCKDAPSPGIIFKGASATAPYTFTYKINNGPDLTVTSSGNTATVNAPTGTAGTFVYSLVRVVEASATQCSQNQSGTATVSVNIKPVVTLSTNAQTFIEGNTAVLCDLDDNPVNVLTPNVITGCVAGNVVWRTQIGVGGWSEWSSTAPTTQPSNNTLYRYQAACEASCEVTYSGIISLTLNYRASTPQNVSVIADGTTIATGEEKSICDQAGNALTFNATCATGEQLLYSVDGGVYLTQVPVQIVDGNFHNYRVRCRKSDGTASCFETESGVMRLKISTTPAAPVVSLNVTSGCGTPISFSGTANCGGLSTVWYNAATNEALPNLPTATPNETTSYYARCQGELGCQSGVSNRVTFTVVPVNTAPTLSVSSDLVCTGMSVTVSANCPAGSRAEWNTGVSGNSFSVSFNNVTTQSYTARCVFENGCQSSISAIKTVRWKAFEVTLINVGQSKSAIKTNDRAAWSAQFITPDSGPSLDYSTQANPTVYHSENLNKTAPRFWTIQVETCALGTNGSLTFNMLSTPETGPVRSYNTHENNAPYFMYANREGWTELYVQNHPAYGFFADNGSGGNLYDEGLPKGLYKLGVRYWDQKGQGSIYPSTRQPAGNVLAYQEYWFRIQSKDGMGVGATRIAAENGQWITDYGFSAQMAPNPVSNTLQLKVNEAKGQKVNVSLSDATGRTLLKRNFVPETNQHQEAFEVGELANGMYFLQVNAGDKQMTLKVIKVQ